MSDYALHPRVYDDLAHITDYYLFEEGSPAAAERVVMRFSTLSARW